jgi:hypothetical protein
MLTASIIRVMHDVAVSTSETYISFYQTAQHSISENSHLHICHCKNLKSLLLELFFIQFCVSLSLSSKNNGHMLISLTPGKYLPYSCGTRPVTNHDDVTKFSF